MNLGFLKADLPKKRAALAVAAVVLVAGVVAGRERPSMDIIQPRAAAVAADDGIDLARLQRGEASLPDKDPFAAIKGVDKKGPAQPAAPGAPPLPFQYFGRLTENGKTEVFVMRGEELLSIAPGQKLGEYRVEQVAESSISFTYLPLKMKQTLDLPKVSQ
jgi:hypothetical protein